MKTVIKTCHSILLTYLFLNPCTEITNEVFIEQKTCEFATLNKFLFQEDEIKAILHEIVLLNEPDELLVKSVDIAMLQMENSPIEFSVFGMITLNPSVLFSVRNISIESTFMKL